MGSDDEEPNQLLIDENLDSGRPLPNDFDSFAARLLDAAKSAANTAAGTIAKHRRVSPCAARIIGKEADSAIPVETSVSATL